jgi:hypothetical protein
MCRRFGGIRAERERNELNQWAIKGATNKSREAGEERPTESKGPNETCNGQGNNPRQAVPMSREVNTCGLELPPILYRRK